MKSVKRSSHHPNRKSQVFIIPPKRKRRAKRHSHLALGDHTQTEVAEEAGIFHRGKQEVETGYQCRTLGIEIGIHPSAIGGIIIDPGGNDVGKIDIKASIIGLSAKMIRSADGK